MDAFAQDLRHAGRLVSKAPGFAAVVVLTLGLGIGANASIFSLLDQVLVRLMPVKDPGALVLLSGRGPNTGWITVGSDAVFPLSHPMYEDFRDRNEVFSGMLARFPTDLHVGHRGGTERARGSIVSGTYFEVLGLAPAAGRLLSPADDRDGAAPAAVLGHAYWQRRFGGTASILGETLAVNGQPATVVGIAPAGFNGIQLGRIADVYVPLSMKPSLTPSWNGLGERRVIWLEVLGRLKPGLTLETARPSLDVLYRQILDAEAAEMAGRPRSFLDRFVAKKLELLPGRYGVPDLRDQLETPLVVLMAMVGLVVLIACANVANLLLARASSRQREIAIRLALGAGRRRVVHQLLVESLLLSLLGAAAGLLMAWWTTGLLLRALPAEGVARSLRPEPDLRVALFALGLALGTSLLVGLVPALQATRPALAATLKGQSASLAPGGGPLRMRKGLVVAQVALSALLLVGAGLFTRSLANLRALDPGFQKQGLLSFGLEPLRSGRSPEQALALYERVRERLLGAPGVRAVTMATEPLMTDSHDKSTVEVEGYASQEGEDMNPNFQGVGPGFFTALGMPLLAGRELDEGDVRGGPKVAVVNETFARYYFGEESPMGRHLGFRHDEALDIEIVGLVRDARLNDVRETIPRFVYLPYAQYEDVPGLVFYVRGDGDATALAGAVRSAVRESEPELPIADLRTMEATIDDLLFVDRIVGGVAAAFGLLATLLAAVGLFGVMSYAVARRTREIGVRVALGADRARILRGELGAVAALAGAGLAVGLPAGWALGRLVEARLFGLTAFDPPTLIAAGAVLASTSALAAALPAHRAARVDPAVALRYE
jgi:predicted permease